MLDDKTYVARYMEGLSKRGVRNVPESQALKDRTEWPHLAPADAAAQRADLLWESDLEDISDDAPETEAAPPPAAAQEPAVAPATPPVAETKPRRAARSSVLAVVPVTTYEVAGRAFTDPIEAVKFAYVTAMEEAIGLPLDIDVLAKAAPRILEITADYINRTRKDD